MNTEQMKRDRAITALIEAGKITEDDAYPTNDINECYTAQDVLIAQHTMNTVIKLCTFPDRSWIKVEVMVDEEGATTIDCLTTLLDTYGSFELSALSATDAAVIKHASKAIIKQPMYRVCFTRADGATMHVDVEACGVDGAQEVAIDRLESLGIVHDTIMYIRAI